MSFQAYKFKFNINFIVCPTLLLWMLFDTSVHAVSPHTLYWTEKKRIGQPDVIQVLRSRSTDVTLMTFNSMLCGGIIGAENYIKFFSYPLNTSISKFTGRYISMLID